MNLLFLAPIIGIVVLILADQIARRVAYAKMNRLYNGGRFEELLDFLEGRYARMFFPAYNRMYAIYNTYEKMGDVEAAERELANLLASKKDAQQRMDILLRAFEFYLKNGRYEKAQRALEKIRGIEKLEPMVEDLAQLYEIIANKSSAYIEDMEKKLEGADPATKHRLYYLLSLQCDNKGDAAAAERYRTLDRELVA